MDSLREKLRKRSHKRWTTVAAILTAVLACAGYDAQASTDSLHADSISRAMLDSVNRAQPGYIVDSIFSAEEEIRRFNAGFARPDRLTGGAASRAELVRRFATALARHDTIALRGLLVSRAEFGYLVFPESPFTRPPYKTKPLLLWTQLVSESERGADRLFERAAGTSARIDDLRCDPAPVLQGTNRYWRHCTVRLRRGTGTSQRLRLFGHILERDGRSKFLSYATDF